MQSKEDNVPLLHVRRNGRHPAEQQQDAPDARDRAIAELKSQVTFLRRELSRRDDVLMFLAGMVGSRTEGASETKDEAAPSGPPQGPVSRTSEKTRGTARSKARVNAEKREWPPLPEGYRVVATASDAWVLVARGIRVAGYRGTLDPEEAVREAWEHHKRGR